jgi:hypothetical protein
MPTLAAYAAFGTAASNGNAASVGIDGNNVTEACVELSAGKGAATFSGLLCRQRVTFETYAPEQRSQSHITFLFLVAVAIYNVIIL